MTTQNLPAVCTPALVTPVEVAPQPDPTAASRPNVAPRLLGWTLIGLIAVLFAGLALATPH